MYEIENKTFICFDNAFNLLGLECIKEQVVKIPDVKLYTWYQKKYLIFTTNDKKHKNNYVYAKAYTCNKVQTTKAEISLNAYYGLGSHTNAYRVFVPIIEYDKPSDLQKPLQRVLGHLEGYVYITNSSLAKIIAKKGGRRKLFAIALKELFN